MARNPFFQAPPAAPEALVTRHIRVLQTFLAVKSVPELQAKLTAAGLAPGLVNQVNRLDEIPDGVINALLARIADPLVQGEVRRRLRL
jgi:hypothetical protein